MAPRWGLESRSTLARPPPPWLPDHGPREVSELRALVKMPKQDPRVLHTEETRFLREWVESMGGKRPPATPKTQSEENKEEKTHSKKVEEGIKRRNIK